MGLHMSFVYSHESHVPIVLWASSSVMVPSFIICRIESGAMWPSHAWTSSIVSVSSCFVRPAKNFQEVELDFNEYRPLVRGISPSFFFRTSKNWQRLSQNNATHPATSSLPIDMSVMPILSV